MHAQPSTVVFVEGASDRVALLRLAERHGRDLRAEGVDVVAIGGAHALGGFLASLDGRNLKLVGLCDVGEAREFTRALDHVFVCDRDLEDELIRALGVPAVERVIDAAGELESFRKFQKQPAWRGRADAEQLRRFLGTHSGRKVQTAALLVDALDLARVPPPLDGVLAHV